MFSVFYLYHWGHWWATLSSMLHWESWVSSIVIKAEKCVVYVTELRFFCVQFTFLLLFIFYVMDLVVDLVFGSLASVDDDADGLPNLYKSLAVGGPGTSRGWYSKSAPIETFAKYNRFSYSLSIAFCITKRNFSLRSVIFFSGICQFRVTMLNSFSNTKTFLWTRRMQFWKFAKVSLVKVRYLLLQSNTFWCFFCDGNWETEQFLANCHIILLLFQHISLQIV